YNSVVLILKTPSSGSSSEPLSFGSFIVSLLSYDIHEWLSQLLHFSCKDHQVLDQQAEHFIKWFSYRYSLLCLHTRITFSQRVTPAISQLRIWVAPK
ncbi:hypothetical protein, partial [Candidatus Albibeggiatoa sp. nov. NOAA]|uniref:hypothetical protein n=1 Tax=Candidatus Albibeggiatoa sp. nov. NOAA TaxID=3162724 RepID=UPI0032FAF211|nr:hypothetical protein [Thiotrichaceae bacterium]